MCTLILGVDVIRPGSVFLAANRDENPSRASEGPRVLVDDPPIAGGRDAVAGGTWLAIRGRSAAVALLNRRPGEGAAAPAPLLTRSRGLLTLDLASVEASGGASLANASRARLSKLLGESAYAPFSVLFASPERSWIAYGGGGPLRGPREIARGWHVITHEDLDDEREPRTSWLRERLRGFAPRNPQEASEGLLKLLRTHGDGKRSPAVCIHEGRMVTVSSSAVYLDGGDARYFHIEGRPCEGAWTDHSALLSGAAQAGAEMKLKDQVALITGGSRGLGLAIANALAAEGAAVSLMARPGAELDAAVASLTKSGARAIAAAADVTKAAEVEAAVKATVAKWGRLDVLVLNAGTWAGASIAETTEQQWDSLLNLNLKGAFLTLKAAIPTLAAQKRGTVVGISSLGALVGQPGSSAYAASKWGLRGFLESAALELKPHHVRVSIVYPHNINSAGRDIAPGTPDRDKNLEPSEIASLVAWICTAPDHVSVGNASIWPIGAGIGMK